MTLQKIRTELSKQGFIDYKFLAKKSNFALYPELLTDLLKKAEDSFDQILQVKNGNISFNTVVETYLNHDHALSTVYTFLESLNSTNTSPSTRKIIETFEPKMVDYANKTTLNKNYYKLLEKVSRQNLTADQARSVSLLLKGMKMSGVFLAEDTRKMVERINKDLSELSQKFENNTIDSRKEFYCECNDKSIVKEMPESDVQAAMAEAEQRKSKSKYVFCTM